MMKQKELQKIFTQKMNANQRRAVFCGFFRMAAEGYRDITEVDAENVRRFVNGKSVNFSDNSRILLYLEIVAVRLDLIKWVNLSDNLNIYIDTLNNLLINIDYKNAAGSFLEDMIIEIKVAEETNSFKEKIEYVSDFQENLLSLEIMELLEDCYYDRDLLIDLNNKAIKAAREAG